MAVVEGPLSSGEAHGSLGRCLTYRASPFVGSSICVGFPITLTSAFLMGSGVIMQYYAVTFGGQELFALSVGIVCTLLDDDTWDPEKDFWEGLPD